MAGWRLPEINERGAVILISGTQQVGKTTLLLALREAATDAGWHVGGILSVARFEAGAKTGIDLLDARTGEVVPLARYVPESAPVSSAVHTKHYVFDEGGLAAGQRFAEAGRGADLYFADELGPLELQRGEGWTNVLTIVRDRDFGCAVVVVRPELLSCAYQRMALDADTPVIAIDVPNRDRLRELMIRWVRGAQRP